jgi:hypothetical protein
MRLVSSKHGQHHRRGCIYTRWRHGPRRLWHLDSRTSLQEPLGSIGPSRRNSMEDPTKRMLWSRSCWVRTREMINVNGAEGTAMSGNCRHSGTGRLCISKILSWQSDSETRVGKKEKKHASSPQSIARKFPLISKFTLYPVEIASREQICTSLGTFLTGQNCRHKSLNAFRMPIVEASHCHEADPDYR